MAKIMELARAIADDRGPGLDALQTVAISLWFRITRIKKLTGILRVPNFAR